MGWEHIPWVTMLDDFDKDHDVDEWHGTNVRIRDGDQIYRTYFIDARGDEQMGNTWNYLDITALGRQEKWEDSPEGYPQDETYQWWIWHDEPKGDGAPTRRRAARDRQGLRLSNTSRRPCSPTSPASRSRSRCCRWSPRSCCRARGSWRGCNDARGPVRSAETERDPTGKVVLDLGDPAVDEVHHLAMAVRHAERRLERHHLADPCHREQHHHRRAGLGEMPWSARMAVIASSCISRNRRA